MTQIIQSIQWQSLALNPSLTNYETPLLLFLSFPSAGPRDMARRAIKLTSWTSAALAASGFYLYNNKYLDPNDFGAVRVGRAVATVGFSHFEGREELQYYLKVNIHVAVDTLVTHIWRYTCTLMCAKLSLYSCTGI